MKPLVSQLNWLYDSIMLNQRIRRAGIVQLKSRREVRPMAVRQPPYSKKEFAQRGDEIYESQVRLSPVGYANASRGRQP